MLLTNQLPSNPVVRAWEEGLSRSFSGHCIKPRVPLTCACDLRELLRVPLRSQGYCAVWRGLSRLLCIWWNVRGTHLELKQEPQCSSPFLTQIARSLHVGTGESGLVFSRGWHSFTQVSVMRYGILCQVGCCARCGVSLSMLLTLLNGLEATDL